MSFSPQLFLSNIKAKDGLAKPSRYEVILPIPPYINEFIETSALEKLFNLPNTIVTDITNAIKSIIGNGKEETKSSNPSISRYLALQCESAELPGKTLQTADVKIYGPGFKVPYQTQYTETTLTFVCTNEFYERKLFERWMEAIMPTDTNNLRYAIDDLGSNSGGYMTNIQIIQYDDFIKKIFVIELRDAFPISIASQPLAWNDDGFHKLSVQFTYQKYRVVYSGSYDIAAAAAALFGTKAASFFDKAGQSISNAFVNPITKILL